MGDVAVIPAWVVPPPGQVRDAHRIAYALYRRGASPAAWRTFEWVTGWGPTYREARAELARSNTPADEIAALTLGWLLGVARMPPVPIPERDELGAPRTADDLYAERVARRYYAEPEDKRRIRDGAERDAARYRRLAALADEALTL